MMTNIARLRVRRDYLAVAKGRKYVRPGLILQSLRRPDSPNTHSHDNQKIHYGLTASKKVGNAVARNRARRRLRVLAETLIPKFGQAGFDYVIIARTVTVTRQAEALAKDLETALKGIHSAPQSAPQKPSSASSKESKSVRKQ